MEEEVVAAIVEAITESTDPWHRADLGYLDHRRKGSATIRISQLRLWKSLKAQIMQRFESVPQVGFVEHPHKGKKAKLGGDKITFRHNRGYLQSSWANFASC